MEKWLAQVEAQMIQSMRDICMEAISAYFSASRSDWLLNWPGQVVICGSSVHWTAEVAIAIEEDALPVRLTVLLSRLQADKNNTKKMDRFCMMSFVYILNDHSLSFITKFTIFTFYLIVFSLIE